MQINQIVKVVGESLFGSTVLSGCEAKVVELDENDSNIEVKVESLTNKNIALWYNINNLHENERELPPIIPKYKEGDIVEVCGPSYIGSSCYMGAKGRVLYPITSDKTEVSYRVKLENVRIPVKFRESDINPLGYNKKVDLSIKDNGSNVEISMNLDKNMEKGRFTVTQNGKPAYHIHIKKLK